MDPSLIARRWDEEYRRGRYVDEPPLPFVGAIMRVLADEPAARAGVGLYVGCGNGRNYLPLVDAGLSLVGLDVSPEAIERLGEHRPAVRSRLTCQDFREFDPDERRFDYLIALQVFQHGDAADAIAYFDKARRVLRPGGLFFLRVNASTTEIYHAHTVTERLPTGAFTIRYDDGPKRGLLVHFYSAIELHALAGSDFAPVIEPAEQVTRRTPPKAGCWSQWEAVWRRV